MLTLLVVKNQCNAAESDFVTSFEKLFFLKRLAVYQHSRIGFYAGYVPAGFCADNNGMKP